MRPELLKPDFSGALPVHGIRSFSITLSLSAARRVGGDV